MPLPRLNAGELNKPLELLAPPEGRDEHNEPVGEGTSLGVLWCKVTPTGSNQGQGSVGEDVVNFYRVKTHWRPDVTTRHALRWRDATYGIDRLLHISSLENVEAADRVLAMDCEEHVA